MTVEEAAKVTLYSVNVPEFEIEELLFRVMVPALGVNVPDTESTPPTVAVSVPVEVEPLTVKFTKVVFFIVWLVPE